ncbi:MAG: hypothetical protein ACRYGR_06440 [Janthinobacterium lividum]
MDNVQELEHGKVVIIPATEPRIIKTGAIHVIEAEIEDRFPSLEPAMEKGRILVTGVEIEKENRVESKIYGSEEAGETTELVTTVVEKDTFYQTATSG